VPTRSLLSRIRTSTYLLAGKGRATVRVRGAGTVEEAETRMREWSIRGHGGGPTPDSASFGVPHQKQTEEDLARSQLELIRTNEELRVAGELARRRLALLVDELMTLTRLQEGMLQTDPSGIDLADAIHEALEEFADEPSPGVERFLPGT
jgi:signal transduction histidine kinase